MSVAADFTGPRELLQCLRTVGVSLWLDNGRLRYRTMSGALPNDLLDALRAFRDGLIALLQGEEIRRCQRSSAPLSYAQERLSFLERLNPGSIAYNEAWAVRLRGHLDVVALTRALHEIVRRHESLRTTIGEESGGTVQRIHDAMPLELSVADVSALADDERTSRTRDLLGEAIGRPFDLTRGPLARWTLLRLGTNEHVLLLTVHHIVWDGWSLGVLTREMTALYSAYVAGHESPLPLPPIQYSDYAVWQRDWMQGAELERQLAYWKGELDRMPLALELPTDRPRPPMQTFRGATVKRSLSPAVKRAVQAVGHAYGATEFMTLLAAFSVLLSRYSGQNRLIIGIPIANRARPESEGLIGFLVNTLALGLRVEGDASFGVLLRDVKERILRANAHQDLPFEKVVDALTVDRDLSRNPVFQVMFAHTGRLVALPELPGLESSNVPIDVEVAKFDLTLDAADADGGYALSWVYNTDLFDAGTIRRMAGHFEVLLGAATRSPDAPCSSLPLMTESERQRVLVEWNTAAAGVGAVCVHELFEAQVERTPEAIAVVFGDCRVTYAELDARANSVAWGLREQGVCPGDIVAVLLPRSIDVIVALLGILKVGAAYLPVEPSLPARRIGHMVLDSGVKVAIVAERPSIATDGVAFIRLPESDRTDRPGVRVEADAIAYVIYTSGSTGAPKGTLVAHRGIANLVAAQRTLRRLAPGRRVLEFASFAFDSSVADIFGALTCGATLVLRGDDVDLHALAQLIRDERVEATTLPPSVLRLLDPADVPSLRYIVTAGEACDEALMHRWSSRELVNEYGPTEFTVCATCAELHGADRVTIGRPLANTAAYVLDERLEPVPIGVAGELCLAGVQLALGYLRRPELTAARFVPNPFAARPGQRMYRTGDLVRWLDDGRLEYLGRIDHQVKLRGLRIELGEIESTLRAMDGVMDATVIMREDVSGDRRLVAYVVAKVQVDALRAELRLSLPEYMIPAAFVLLEALPLTANGKVDKTALPAPERASSSVRFVAPRDDLERSLASIWEAVLRAPRVGLHDNFFELGGDSLLAIRAVSRIRADLRIEIVVRDMLECPTVEMLAARAARMARGEASTAGSNLVRLRAGGAKLPIFCVHPVDGGLSGYLPLVKLFAPQHPLIGLQAAGLEGNAPALSTIEEMASRYVDEMIHEEPCGPYRILGWSVGAVIAFEMARQLSDQGRLVDFLALLDPPTPGNAAPLDETLPIFIEDAARASGRWSPALLDGLAETSALAADERVNAVFAHAQRHGLFPREMTIEELRSRVRVFEANRRALSTWVPTGSYRGEAVLVAAEGGNGEFVGAWRAWLDNVAEFFMLGCDHYEVVTASVARLMQHVRKLSH